VLIEMALDVLRAVYLRCIFCFSWFDYFLVVLCWHSTIQRSRLIRSLRFKRWSFSIFTWHVFNRSNMIRFGWLRITHSIGLLCLCIGFRLPDLWHYEVWKSFKLIAFWDELVYSKFLIHLSSTQLWAIRLSTTTTDHKFIYFKKITHFFFVNIHLCK